MQPSQLDRRKADPLKSPGEKYTAESYRRAIQAVCRAQKIPIWAPNQIRHTVRTVVRARFGLEASQVALGHATANVTEIYAQRNQRLAADLARQIG